MHRREIAVSFETKPRTSKTHACQARKYESQNARRAVRIVCTRRARCLYVKARAATGGNLLRHHHLHELLVVDLPVTIDVSLADHLVDLLVRQLLAEVRHHVAKLRRADGAVAITIEHLEGL